MSVPELRKVLNAFHCTLPLCHDALFALQALDDRGLNSQVTGHASGWKASLTKRLKEYHRQLWTTAELSEYLGELVLREIYCELQSKMNERKYLLAEGWPTEQDVRVRVDPVTGLSV